MCRKSGGGPFVFVGSSKRTMAEGEKIKKILGRKKTPRVTVTITAPQLNVNQQAHRDLSTQPKIRNPPHNQFSRGQVTSQSQKATGTVRDEFGLNIMSFGRDFCFCSAAYAVPFSRSKTDGLLRFHKSFPVIFPWAGGGILKYIRMEG